MTKTMTVNVNIDATGDNANLDDNAIGNAVADLLESLDVVGGTVTINI